MAAGYNLPRVENMFTFAEVMEKVGQRQHKGGVFYSVFKARDCLVEQRSFLAFFVQKESENECKGMVFRQSWRSSFTAAGYWEDTVG